LSTEDEIKKRLPEKYAEGRQEPGDPLPPRQGFVNRHETKIPGGRGKNKFLLY
jgi:hypothetical protein